MTRAWMEHEMKDVPDYEWTKAEVRDWKRYRPLKLYRVGRKNRDSGCFSRRFYDGSKLVVKGS